MKTPPVLILAISLALSGCAANSGENHTRFQPRPPYLINALADSADTVADYAPGPLKYPPRLHATILRSLTPGFWLEKRNRDRADLAYLSNK